MLWTLPLIAIAMFVCLPLYLHYKRSMRLHLACCYKCVGTLCAILPALIAAIRLEPRCWICVAALVLYCIADYVLEFNFMFGAGVFLCGHICIIAYFLGIAPVSVIHLVAVLVMGACSLFICWRWRKTIGKQMAGFIVYGASLVFMAACALGCYSTNGAMGILIACGGPLFFLSDMILLRRELFPSPKIFDWGVMITYYGSILLIGISCLLYA